MKIEFDKLGIYISRTMIIYHLGQKLDISKYLIYNFVNKLSDETIFNLKDIKQDTGYNIEEILNLYDATNLKKERAKKLKVCKNYN